MKATLSQIAKTLGKRGSEKRKKQNPDYSTLGRKGANKRWKKLPEDGNIGIELPRDWDGQLPS